MGIRLNHIGFVVRNISEFAELFGALGLREVTKPEPDPTPEGDRLLHGDAG